jgi:hypothetical protein
VPPPRGLIVSAPSDRLDPRYTLNLSIPSIGYPGFIGVIILQDCDGGRVEDTEDLAALLEIDGLTPQRRGGEELRR